jgi:phosphatidyl-myo-inositol dimannoside synthase
VCRIVGKALHEYGLSKNKNIAIYSMHDPKDAAEENIYFPAEIFKGYSAAKISFIKEAVAVGVKSDVVILSHINLLVVAWLIKKVKPSAKIILMAHGIEVWKPLNKLQRMMLGVCDKIASVSSFTKEKIESLHHIDASKNYVLNNCIDPFLVKPKEKKRDAVLTSRYGIKNDDIVLLTLTRLSHKDRYKGYDFVLDALKNIVKKYPTIKYILAGTYEQEEKKYIDTKISNFGLINNVVITGFIAEEELPSLFSMADVYVMPSVKEGFGIVFIEAMYYGVPVIAANVDGSTDALLQGKLGVLIPPENPQRIEYALESIFGNNQLYAPNYNLLMDNFGYDAYKGKVEELLIS